MTPPDDRSRRRCRSSCCRRRARSPSPIASSSRCAAIASIGEASTAWALPLPDSERVNDSTCCSTSVLGSTSGVELPDHRCLREHRRALRERRRVVQLGLERRERILVELRDRGVDVLLGDLGEHLARAAARRRRVGHPNEVAVVAGRHDADLASVDVAVRPGLRGRDRDLARGAADADVGRAAGDPRDRQEHGLVELEPDAAPRRDHRPLRDGVGRRRITVREPDRRRSPSRGRPSCPSRETRR